MSTAIKIEIGATLWRNGSDGEPQVRLILPDGEPALLRVRKSSPKAYALCVAALDAAAEAEAEEGSDLGHGWRKVGTIYDLPPEEAQKLAVTMREMADSLDPHAGTAEAEAATGLVR